MNHFVPLVPIDSLEPGTLAKTFSRLQDEINQLQDQKQKDFRAFLESGHTPEKNPEEWQMYLSLAQHTSEQICKAEGLLAVQTRVAIQGLLAIEVPAEGNCALHSLTVLNKESLNAATEEEVMKLRSEIADAWENATQNERWIHIYNFLVKTFDTRPTSSSPTTPKGLLKTEAKRPKQELATTPKRKSTKIPGHHFI